MTKRSGGAGKRRRVRETAQALRRHGWDILRDTIRCEQLLDAIAGRYLK